VHTKLLGLGWSDHFASQLTDAEQQTLVPMRVVGAQRTGLTIRGVDGQRKISLAGRWFQEATEDRPTIGDWLLLRDLDLADPVVERRLQRKSVLARRSPGAAHEMQLLGANVDILFIVTSCNQEFNARRLERYVAFAFAAGVQPVLVLTKIDLCEDAAGYVAQAEALQGGAVGKVPVLSVNATQLSSADVLAPWCNEGVTVALMGSSGVGKSTLLNSLLGDSIQTTGAIREEDGKGRHTTTDRSLHLLPGGGLVLDSPGIRELQISDAEQGVQDLFDDIAGLAMHCRFNDCQHRQEPKCAVQQALQQGRLDPQRFASYCKLQAGD
jgi:ribosome biogenesis GTPase